MKRFYQQAYFIFPFSRFADMEENGEHERDVDTFARVFLMKTEITLRSKPKQCKKQHYFKISHTHTQTAS